MNDSEVEMAWIAAVLAPWTVSPHPNFSGGEVTAAQGLALVTERRESDRNRNRDDANSKLTDSWPAWGIELVEAARNSLGIDSQSEATADLWALAERGDVPVGGRVAAAAYAALGSLELDRAFESVDRLGGLLTEIKGSMAPSECEPSFRLAVAILEQQRVVRAQDSSRFDEALRGIDEVARWLPNLGSTGFEGFELSKGISWSASRVQKDMLLTTKQNALSSKAQLEPFGGETWVRVVRGRTGWIDLRHYLLERNRNAAVVRDDFEGKFDSTSGKRVFGRATASDIAYVALLAAELSGDSGRARNSRAEMAKIHLLAQGDTEFHTREALRLLRQSHDNAALKSALSWIRAEGPLTPLRRDALSILERASRDQYASESDLLLLESASDVLTQEELAQAIDVASIYLETQRRNDRVAWSHLDNVWKAITRFVPGSDRDQAVAEKAAALLLEPQVLTRPLTTTIARLVSEIDWTHVSDQTRSVWNQWVESRTIDEEVETLVLEVRNVLDLPDIGLDVASGLEAAAILADEGLPVGADIDLVRDAREVIVNSLRSESAAAANGAFAFGGIAPSNVGVAFSLRFEEYELWGPIVEHLLEPKVISGHKELALDRLAANASRVPFAVRDELAAGWRDVANSRRDSGFGGEPLAVFPQAIRMAAAFGALTPTEGISAILQLAAGSDTGRIEAARSIPFVVGNGDATWAHVLLLQLAEDRNPNTRAEAGFAMIRLLASTSSVTEMVIQSARLLLLSDGIRCALRVLHGLQSVAEAQPAVVQSWLPTVRQMASEDQRRVVRGAAAELLKIVSG